MARDVEINLTANDKTGSGINSAAKNFNKLDETTKRITKKIGDLPLGAIGGQLGNDLAKNLAKGLAPVAQYAVPAIAAIGVGAAPLIGAAISGAIIAGAGIGVAGIGLAVAAQDARVQAAFQNLANGLKSRLNAAGGAFVAPAIAGISTIKKALDSIDIEGLFKNSAKFVEPLAAGVGKAIESLGNGIESLVANAGPAISAVADGIAGIGKAVGEGLEGLADNGEASADALRVLFGVINSSISSVLNLVNVLTELYEINRAIGGDTGLRLLLKALGQDLDSVGENGRKAGSGTFSAASGIQKAGEAAGAASAPIKSVAEQLQDAADAGRALYDSQTSAAEALSRAAKAARDNSAGLSTNSEKGRENRGVISNLAGALNRQYSEFVKVNGAGAQADALGSRLRASFIRAAEGFGIGAGKARDLANKILGIPQKRDAKINVDSARAKQNALDVRSAINSVQGKTVYINVIQRFKGDGKNENSPSIGGGGGRQFSAAAFMSDDSGSNRQSKAMSNQPINVNNDVRVLLDGTVLDVRTDTKIRKASKYEAHKMSVGRVV